MFFFLFRKFPRSLSPFARLFPIFMKLIFTHYQQVVVMGSSTASEATINTSTDSASTHITNMTTTDTETLDSLDLG